MRKKSRNRLQWARKGKDAHYESGRSSGRGLQGEVWLDDRGPLEEMTREQNNERVIERVCLPAVAVMVMV